MRTLFWFALPFLILAGLTPTALAVPGPCVVDPARGNPVLVEIDTTAGIIEMELWPDIAPCTVNNFLSYADTGRYDGTFIHRSVTDFVVQGGGFAYDAGSDTFAAITLDVPVVGELGASNLMGTVAMARVGTDIDSATSQFFVNLVDNVALDTTSGGYTVFGQVVPATMPVVDAIGALPSLIGNWELNSSLRETFGELPVHDLPHNKPFGYGCFDPNEVPLYTRAGWYRSVINTGGNGLEPDPLTGGAHYVSTSCSGSGASGPPEIPCALERQVAFWGTSQWYIDPDTMTCDQIAQSEESLARRRDHHHPQIVADLVGVSTVFVPEPGSSTLLVSGVMGLYALARRRGRRSTRR
jgi:cyclophilin family peptidyl-prolyl cis-trans isomerase